MIFNDIMYLEVKERCTSNVLLYIYMYMYIVVKTPEFSENNELNIVDVELYRCVSLLLRNL